MFSFLGNKENWNQKIINQGSDFLQSWQWGEFQKSIGQKVIRQEIADMPVQIIKYPLPMGQSYLYGPHLFSVKCKVPTYAEALADKQSAKLKEELQELQELKVICKKENAIFLRVDFLAEKITETATELQRALREAKFQPAPENYYFSAVSQSPHVAHLDISGSEEQILSAMRYNTRRSIRLAKNRGIIVEQSEDIESFFNLLTQTSQRKNVSLHPREHYFKLKQALGSDLVLLMAYKKYRHSEAGATAEAEESQGVAVNSGDTPKSFGLRPQDDSCTLLAGAMILFFGKQATYLHAGSLSGSQNQEAPYLILWYAIQEAKKRGCKILDLGAVAPEGSQNHPWQSITTFKMGWRPRAVNYLPAYDWVNKQLWYKLYCWKKNLK